MQLVGDEGDLRALTDVPGELDVGSSADVRDLAEDLLREWVDVGWLTASHAGVRRDAAVAHHQCTGCPRQLGDLLVGHPRPPDMRINGVCQHARPLDDLLVGLRRSRVADRGDGDGVAVGASSGEAIGLPEAVT